MKVIMRQTGKTAEVNDSYGKRLIEQGTAVPPPPADKRTAAVKPARPKETADRPAGEAK